MELRNADAWLKEYEERLKHASPERQARTKAFYDQVHAPMPSMTEKKAEHERILREVRRGRFRGRFDYPGGLEQLKRDLENGVFDE